MELGIVFGYSFFVLIAAVQSGFDMECRKGGALFCNMICRVASPKCFLFLLNPTYFSSSFFNVFLNPFRICTRVFRDSLLIIRVAYLLECLMQGFIVSLSLPSLRFDREAFYNNRGRNSFVFAENVSV